MAKYATLNDLIYFDQKATEWNKEHFVQQKSGMSLISDTTITKINQHFTDLEQDATINLSTSIDEYFRNKTLSLTTSN